MTRLLRRWFVCATAGMATACGSTQTLRTVPPTPNRGQEITFWRNGRAERLHGVRAIGDSITGIPLTQPLSCDSCRVVYRAAEIDSVGVRRTDQAAIFLATLPFAALVIGTTIWRAGDKD